MTHRAPSFSSFFYGWTYDVFLNFRGEDTRHGFTGNLYNALCETKIRTFIDEELRRGEEIAPALVKAIEESQTAIIIFSINYASSTYCLEELVKILECIREKGRRVWPIFYEVDPSDVRYQRGSYGEALAKHEEKFKDDKSKVQNWRMALQKAASLSGWHYEHGYEYEFIRKIVEEVSKNCNHKPLHVDNYPIGLESPEKEIISLLDVGSNEGVNKIRGSYGIRGTMSPPPFWTLQGSQALAPPPPPCLPQDVREFNGGGLSVMGQSSFLDSIISARLLSGIGPFGPPSGSSDFPINTHNFNPNLLSSTDPLGSPSGCSGFPINTHNFNPYLLSSPDPFGPPSGCPDFPFNTHSFNPNLLGSTDPFGPPSDCSGFPFNNHNVNPNIARIGSALNPNSILTGSASTLSPILHPQITFQPQQQHRVIDFMNEEPQILNPQFIRNQNQAQFMPNYGSNSFFRSF